MRWHWLLCGVAAMIAGAASAQTRIDLSNLDKGWVGPRTQVLVLGTVHLSNAPKGFKHQSLEK
jgi:hypothetical protein